MQGTHTAAISIALTVRFHIVEEGNKALGL